MTLVDIKGVPYLLWETTEAQDNQRTWRLFRVVPWGKESRTVTLTPVSCSCEWFHYELEGTARERAGCKHIHFIRENER
jgi:hypothetical protein